MVELTFNGEKIATPSNKVSTLLLEYKITERQIAVELNSQIVPRNQYETTLLHDGDVIEVVQFVGGG